MSSIVSSSEFKESIRINSILVGNAGVGKTSFLQRATGQRKTIDDVVSTIGVDFHCHNLLIPVNHHRIEHFIFDTAGEERFHSLTQSYFRKAHLVFLIFDVTDRKSFESIMDVWVPMVNQSNDQCSFVVVGNKHDIDTKQNKGGEADTSQPISGLEIKRLANQLGEVYGHVVPWFVVSSKTDERNTLVEILDTCVIQVAKRLLENKKKEETFIDLKHAIEGENEGNCCS